MSAFKTLIPLIRSKTTTQTISKLHRSLIHTRVPLPYELESGLEPFLSTKALKVVAKEWQEGVLDRLNVLVEGTECEGLPVLQTLKQTASDVTRSTTFNHASEALNNSFFLSTLTPKTTPLDPSSALSQSMITSFSSYSSFQSRFSSHVAGLHPSSGAYVWLVTDTSGKLGIVGTYAGGTILVYQRMQMGNIPSMGAILGETIIPKTGLDVDNEEAKKKPTSIYTTIPAGNTMSDTFKKGINLGTDSSRKPIHPLVCLSLHPHCYLSDYGIWGRQEYVKRWFEAVDWTKIEASYNQIVSKSKAV